jgi:ubiquinone biosynthesis protein Coq4
MTVAQALAVFFARYGLDREGYRAPRLVVKLGPLPLPFPNPGWLPLHDLHHVALALPPTFWGEVELSAFELRTGPRTALIAFLCIGALFFGALVGPRRVARAWRRYAGAVNLYREEHYESLLTMDLEALRRRMRLPAALP